MRRMGAPSTSICMSIRATIGAVAMACVLQPASAETIEKSLPADARGEVKIVNVAGDVHVVGWDRSEVKVNADLGSGVERLEFVSEGGRTEIEVVLPSRGSRSGATDLRVHVPRESSLIINTVSAEQTIDGVRGAQRLTAVSGSITTESWGREFEANSVSGEVEVRGHGGDSATRVTTVSGDMRIENVGPEVELETVNGEMNLRTEELSRARIKSTNGDLELSARLASAARIEAEAVNGNLRMLLAKPVNAEFDIETFNGDIDNCFGPEPRRTREFGPGNELRFREGKGGARVRIRTLNGGVEVCGR
jgi:DUF4097 and DUF4098 domain-containing protein YvlB